MLLWAVYKRRQQGAYWNLLFVVPATVAESDVEKCIEIVDTTIDSGYRNQYLMLKQDDEQVSATIPEQQEYYRG